MTLSDGNAGRNHRLKNLFSTGLAVLLNHEEEQAEIGLVTAAGCILDDSSRCSIERGVAHVLGVSPGVLDAPMIVDDKLNLPAVKTYLTGKLDEIQGTDDDARLEREGIFINDSALGPGVVTMDKESSSGNIKFNKTRLVLESQSIFSSARANVCVWQGQWIFEATLGTAGIQQLGWATLSCPFTHLKGVGDAEDSYAFDGKRIRKWGNNDSHEYGQLWVTGDVIGCCIDLDTCEISFYRNGVFLGVAFEGIRKFDSKQGYFPAISLSHGERCELNFGSKPFKYPVKGFSAIQTAPGGRVSASSKANFLLGCLQRLVQLDSREVLSAMSPIERLKTLAPLNDCIYSVLGSEIAALLRPLLSAGERGQECSVPSGYVIWGCLVPFLIDTYRSESPHDAESVDRALRILLPCLDQPAIEIIMDALSYGCRTSPFASTPRPYTGSYQYLALACHLLEQNYFMEQWWSTEGFELCVEGLLTKKVPNKHDLKALMPTVWWYGSREGLCSASKMQNASISLSKAVSKVEELHWELCCKLLHFIPPVQDGAVGVSPLQEPGLVFKLFLRNLISKNSGANRNMPPPGLSDNSVLVAVYYVLLRFLSEGCGIERNGATDIGTSFPAFLHRVGKRKFPVEIFLKVKGYSNDFARLGGTFSHLSKTIPRLVEDYEEVQWDESSMDEDGASVKHGDICQPACCLDLTVSTMANELSESYPSCSSGSVSERGSIFTFPLGRSSNGSPDDVPSFSGRVDARVGRSLLQSYWRKRADFKAIKELSDAIKEEELLDTLVVLYHLGLAPYFKQASYDMQAQVQLIAHLEDTDRQISTEKIGSENLKKLKEERAICKEKLIDCVRRCTWHRVSLFSKWKQRGMYATCMWLVQLLLVLSKRDRVFAYIPEFYVETLVDSFHTLRRSDPPFIMPASAFLQQGLSPLVTFLVTHFSDLRIANPDIRDILLQSISVLVQYKEHVTAFEKCRAAKEGMVGSLLAAFDNRFWIPVSNILLRLCKGGGFGASKCYPHGEPFSFVFQKLLKDKCIEDEKLFASFLNRLFNTLNWTVTEFSISIKEMQELTDRHCKVTELQQRKCTIMFELSCNLERILEFFTQELPSAFLHGAEMNLVRLCELIIFVLSHTTSSSDAQIFDSPLRQQGQCLEKINRSMILAPIVGIVLNLSAARSLPNHGLRYDISHVFADVDVSASVLNNLKYLLDHNWAASFKGDPSLKRLPELKAFVKKLRLESEAARRRTSQQELLQTLTNAEADENDDMVRNGTGEDKVDMCSICYAGEVDTIFLPCKHQSCIRCITRHLLNNQRCFFCNATISELCSMSAMLSAEGDYPASNAADTADILAKNDSP